MNDNQSLPPMNDGRQQNPFSHQNVSQEYNRTPTKGNSILRTLVIAIIILFSCFFFFMLVLGSILKEFLQMDEINLEDGDKVGVVEIEGALTSAKQTVLNLHQFAHDDEIKAIVVRVNSPGGPVGPAQEIFREIEKVKKIKKVVASLGNVAASGGYYAIASADYIIANPGTLTGSIGVISQFANFSGLIKLAKIKTTILKTGQYKDSGSPFRDINQADKELFNKLLKKILNQFINDIVKGRGIEFDQVKKIADGRVITGEGAIELKLVDQQGNFLDAVKKAGELAGIKDMPKIIYPRKDRRMILRELLQDAAEGATRGVVEEVGTFWHLATKLIP